MGITKNTFWDAIEILRKEVGLSKVELARRAQIDPSIFGLARRKHRALHLHTLAKVGKVLVSMGISRREYALLVDLLAQMDE